MTSADPMLYYVHDHKLKRPFATLLAGVQNFLALATPGTRQPIEASLSRLDPARPGLPAVTDSMRLKRGFDFAPRVQAVMDRIGVHAEDPDSKMSVYWVPDFQGPATSSFAILGIDPQARQEGANYRHALQLVGAGATGAGPHWLMCALVLPFEPGSDAFQTFRDQAASALGFALAAGAFRHLERTRAGSFKVRKLAEPLR